MRSLTIFCLLLLVPALIFGTGSAGLATHASAKFTYQLQYPADWQTRSLAESGFFEASSQTDIASLPSIFRVDVVPLSAPLADYASHLRACVAEIRGELTEQGAKNIKILESREISLGKTRALRIDYKYTLYGTLVMRAIAVRIPHLQWQYNLACNNEDGWYFEQSAEDFESIIASFKIQRPNQDYLENYIRSRADLSGGESVFHWQGKAYSFIPGEKRKELFDVEGYNIVQAIPDERGYLLLGKEVMLFLDSRSGEILETWLNPISGRDVNVVQVFNDPANMDLRFSDEQFQMLHLVLPSTELDGQIAWHNDLFPFYPNPLTRKEYPLFSQSDTYQAADISQFTVNLADLEDPLQQSVPALYSFTRIYPWLPFMRMGERPGNLMMVCRGHKLSGGFEDLPQHLQDFVLARNPDFAHAPDAYSQPNQTIWNSFKEMAPELERGKP